MKHLHLSAPIELRATPAGLPARFTGTAYSGGLVPSINVVIDLARTGLPGRLPLLCEHDREAIIGVIERASVEGGALLVAGRLFSDIPGTKAERIAQLGQRGAPFQMSVGLYGYREEAIPAGAVATVNSQTVVGPATVLHGGTVRECSIVTLGADPSTAAQLFGATVDRGPELSARRIYQQRQRAAGGW